MPRITVIIPSYNHEKYVAQAIQSVLGQTYQDFEIVITDDGSSDHTVEIIQTFADPRIRLFCFEKNQGASVAMNNCIQQARGEYIAVLNSDDIFFPDKLRIQIAFLDTHPEIGAVFGYAHLIDDEGNDFVDATHFLCDVFRKKNRTRFAWLNHFFFHGNALCHPSVLIRKECYERIGTYDERMASQPDFDFWIRLCMQYDIHVIPSNLIKFRIRNGEANASGDRREFRVRGATEFVFALRNFLSIANKEIFFKIFPKAQQYEESFEVGLVPFYLAQLSLDGPAAGHWNVYQNFAIESLFNLLADCRARENMYSKHAFSVADFIRLTGELDTYNIEMVRTRDSQLQSTTAQLKSTAEQLLVITSTTGWRILQKIYYFVDKIFPSGTKRKNMYLFFRRYITKIIRLATKLNLFLRKGKHIPMPRQEENFVGDGDFKKIGEEFLSYFIALGGLKKTDAVLDIGCGIGRMAIPLAGYLGRKATYSGFDVVDAAVNWCNEHIRSQYPNFKFHHSSIKNLLYHPKGDIIDENFEFPFSSESFDFIFLTSVFTHMRKEGVIHYTKEIFRTLKKGKRCFVTLFLINDESLNLIRDEKSTQKFSEYGDYYTTNSEIPETALAYNEEYIIEMFADAGFFLLNIKYGSWCGRKEFLSYQDILIFEK